MLLSSKDVLKTVEDCMKDVFGIDDANITEATTAHDIEEWDSLSHIRLMVAIERAYNIRFSNAEMESLANVGDLIRTIAKKIG